jgi:replication fork protection complex subunit Tof1/Swi1
VVKPSDEKCKLAMFKNGYVRLLMTLIGFQRVGEIDDPDALWTIPPSLSADQLKQSLELINRSEFSPPAFDDGREAADFIRRKSAGAAGRRRAIFDDEDDGIDDDEDEELLFPAGGPTAMKRSDVLKELKKTRRRRRQEGTEESEDDGLTEEQLKARRDARREKELEKNRKIKSELFVHDSDDETDEERDKAFFEAEEKLRQRSKIEIMKELLGVGESKGKLAAKNAKKRQSSAMSADSNDDVDVIMTGNKKRKSSAISIDSDDEAGAASGRSSSAARDNVLAESEDEATDTPMSSPHTKSSQWNRRKVSGEDEPVSPVRPSVMKDALADTAMSDDDEEDALPAARPARQRTRAGFIFDSSDEE